MAAWGAQGQTDADVLGDDGGEAPEAHGEGLPDQLAGLQEVVHPPPWGNAGGGARAGHDSHR